MGAGPRKLLTALLCHSLHRITKEPDNLASSAEVAAKAASTADNPRSTEKEVLERVRAVTLVCTL